MVVALGIIIIVGGIVFATRSGGTSNTDTILPATTTPDAIDTTVPPTDTTGDSTEGRTSAPLETLAPGAPVSTPRPVGSPAMVHGYTLGEVALHKDATSCWTAIEGKVYNLTSWIHEHPGGAKAILSICGKDGTASFNDQHGGQAKPAKELAEFLLGDLRP